MSVKEGLNLVRRIKFKAWEREHGIAIVEMALKGIWNKVWVEIGVRAHLERVWETGIYKEEGEGICWEVWIFGAGVQET